MSLNSKNKLDTNKYELSFTADAASLEEAVQRAYKKNIKKINVPGFRQGKAPRKMVEKLYGEGVFYEDAVNELYPKALSDAIKEAEIEVVAPPQIDVKSIDKEKGIEFTAICITKPEVEVKDYKGIKVEKEVETVSKEDVEKRIEAMRERNARLTDITDRAAKKGDTVIFDFDGYVDDKQFDGGKAENFSLELGSGQFIPGFEDQMEGKEIDVDFDVNVTFPEDYHAEELKGKPAVFKCKIHQIKEKELPALDDEFAKDVSEFDTLDELKADIEKKMQETLDNQANTEVENKLIDKVIDNMTAEIPEEMYEARIDDMVRDFEYRLQSQGMNMDLYLQYTGMQKESFRETFREQAQKQVKIRLALEKIVEIEDIKATEQEIEDEYKKVADGYKMEVEQVKAFIPQDEFEKDIAVNKAIDMIKESAEITEKKKTAKKAAAKKTTAKKETAKKEAADKAE